MASAFPHQKRFFVIVILAVSALLFLLSTQAATTMFGLFKKYDVHLSPEVHGVITNNGAPVVGLKVFRGLTYVGDKELLDKTVTDKNGAFSFAEKNIRSRRPSSMFHEARIRQIIDVDYQNERYLLWAAVMTGIAPSEGVAKKLSQLNCDLSDSEEYYEFDNIESPDNPHGVESICRWELTKD
ncbi:DUF4198 domain-containing protein [Colwellia sp. MSW7]|jgi:hypothetical protein|uniref:DUF4198 domain-containing protein n=1 Tax=Colwellia maritima TaxID=2912588 RepID=A0ABS9X2A6_9GAMM|nr:DUF4198 domain-containing protein [Colwellia maritima]MCI2284341.1 DUF4198 domain-containing protein [Colwellia maritima]